MGDWQQAARAMANGWWYDADTNCWRSDDQSACVAKDGRGAKPWGAWHTSTSEPDSWHATLNEAIAACEAARKEQGNG